MTEPALHELLSALLDREPVDPDALAAILERAEARALLVDFVRLRTVLQPDGLDAPAVTSRTLPQTAPRTPAKAMLQLAAAILLVALGALAGHQLSPADVEPPPEPTRVVPLVPAGGAL
jgi:hypothetical protein